jgi:predicted glycosyltransferase
MKLTFPFTDVICTPSCFKRDLGHKQVRFNGYKELAYLHPKYFKPDIEVLEDVGLTKTDAFIILRFVSWNASHDIGLSGIKKGTEMKFIKSLEQYGKVFISSEKKMNADLDSYSLPISPEKIHSLMSFARLYIGEGGTMATESAILGTPSIHIESANLEKPSAASIFCGNFIELRDKYDLLYMFTDQERALEKAISILEDKNSKQKWQIKKDKLIKDKEDVTKFMVKMVEKYV